MAGPDYPNSQYVPKAWRRTTGRDRLRDAKSARDPLGHLGRRSGGHRFCHQSFIGSAAHPRPSSGRQGKMACHHRSDAWNRYLAKDLRSCSSSTFLARNTDRQSFQIFAGRSRHLVRSAVAGPNAQEIGASQKSLIWSPNATSTPPARLPLTLRRQTRLHPTSVPAERPDYRRLRSEVIGPNAPTPSSSWLYSVRPCRPERWYSVDCHFSMSMRKLAPGLRSGRQGGHVDSRHATGLPSSRIDSEVLGYCCPL